MGLAALLCVSARTCVLWPSLHALFDVVLKLRLPGRQQEVVPQISLAARSPICSGLCPSFLPRVRYGSFNVAVFVLLIPPYATQRAVDTLASLRAFIQDRVWILCALVFSPQ